MCIRDRSLAEAKSENKKKSLDEAKSVDIPSTSTAALDSAGNKMESGEKPQPSTSAKPASVKPLAEADERWPSYYAAVDCEYICSFWM